MQRFIRQTTAARMQPNQIINAMIVPLDIQKDEADVMLRRVQLKIAR